MFASSLARAPKRLGWRRIVSYLRSDVGDIYLVGTAHLGKRSREEVVEVIGRVKPASVLVELCDGRAAALGRKRQSAGDALRATLERFGVDAASARVALRLAERLSGGLSGEQGGDMREAMAAARTCGAAVVHGDLDGAVTERALREAVRGATASPVGMASLAMRLSADPDIREILGAMAAATAAPGDDGALDAVVGSLLDRGAARRLAGALDRHLPDLARALLHDRDDFMAAGLAKLAKRGTTIGVVGIAHVDGIERRFPDATILHM